MPTSVRFTRLALACVRFARLAAASAAAAAVVVTSATGLTRRQASGGPVFTAEQAAAGRKAFDRACASCHMTDLSGNTDAPPLAGAVFLDTWRGRTTKELFEYIGESMPPGGPTENEDTYRSIVAFILRSNGALPGERPFEKGTAAPIASVTRP